MDALLIFFEKPSTANKDFAIQIAKKHNAVYDNGRYKLVFHEFSNEIKKILEISQSWKTAQLFIDNKEYSIQNLVFKLNCYNKSHCNGLCYYIRDLSTITRLKSAIGEHYSLQHWMDNYLDHITGLERINDTLEIDREKIKEYIYKKIDPTLMFCELFDINKIYSLIDTLPNTIELKRKNDTIENSNQKPKFTIDLSNLFENTENEDEEDTDEIDADRYKKIAEIMAPIFAKAIVTELLNSTKKE